MWLAGGLGSDMQVLGLVIRCYGMWFTRLVTLDWYLVSLGGFELWLACVVSYDWLMFFYSIDVIGSDCRMLRRVWWCLINIVHVLRGSCCVVWVAGAVSSEWQVLWALTVSCCRQISMICLGTWLVSSLISRYCGVWLVGTVASDWQVLLHLISRYCGI